MLQSWYNKLTQLGRIRYGKRLFTLEGDGEFKPNIKNNLQKTKEL